ncbi:hypothetical protein LTS08_004891 [Lithohypha guttulata]|nr:hypothetical protein LTS08_004891 [Lithohypha guttulata]
MSTTPEHDKQKQRHVKNWLKEVNNGDTSDPVKAHNTNGSPEHLSNKPSKSYCADHTGIAETQDDPALDPTVKYAKRRRHRTKADKYEYKGSLEPKNRLTKKRGTNPTKLKGVPSAHENFRADNVHSIRVSLKPDVNTGFSRSKTSAPLAGRDTADLTFPTMDFLTTPAHDVSSSTAKLYMRQARQEDARRKKRKLTQDDYALKLNNHKNVPPHTSTDSERVEAMPSPPAPLRTHSGPTHNALDASHARQGL